jgi:pimeloyl-ACP methyl ester carboxylesterase
MEFTDFGGDGPVMHFAHANAYPPGSYRRMLEPLTADRHVKCLHWLPLVQPDHHPHFRRWVELIPDLIDFIETECDPPILAGGHSMGATITILTAVRRPDLFRALALIDPVMLPLKYVLSLQLTPERWRSRIPIIRKALNRPDCWETRQAAFDFHRRARVFRRMDDEALWDYVNAGTRECEGGGYKLSFPREWEARIYATCPWIWPALKRCRVPMLAVRGEHSDTVLDESWRSWRRLHPKARFLQVPDAGHLVPMERPQTISNAIADFFAAV